MINTGLKTFAYSFVFSLFAIFVANKTLCRPDESPIQSIPHSNIAAFLKSSPAVLTSDKAKVKKIVLIKEDKPLRQAEIGKEKAAVWLAAKPIPPQKTQAVDDKTEKLVEKPAKKERIIAALENVKLPVRKDAAPKSEQSPTLAVEKIKAKEAKPQQVEIAAKKESPLDLLAFGKASQPEPKEKKLIEVVKEEKPEELLLIPLQRDNRKIAGMQEKIKINGDEAQKQVAMLKLDQPIKNVVAETENKAGSLKGALSAAEAEQWVPMAQKSGEKTVKREADAIYDVSKVEIPEKSEEIEVSAGESEKTNVDSESGAGLDTGKESAPDDEKWAAAKGTKFPVNQHVLEQDYYKQAQDTKKITEILSGEKSNADNEVKVAGEVVQNILIPIPEEIINNKDLMPQLVSDPENKKIEEDLLQKEQSMLKENGEDVPFIAENKGKSDTETKESEDKGLLKSLSSLFSSTESDDKKTVEKSSGDKEKNAPERILPTEIRLSFQPNRAEISGKTLDWIQAFANKTKENEHTVLEIRLDGTSSFELQQKRLNLLYNILTNLGLDYRKVNTVFTNREPNSFVLRVVMRGDRSSDLMSPVRAMYYKKW